MHRVILISLLAVFLLAGCASENTVIDPADSQNTYDKENDSAEKQEDKVQNTKDKNENIECHSDSDCGERRIENAYCFQTNPVGDIYDWECVNPGTTEATCKEVAKQGIIDECSDMEFCRDGKCVKYANCNDTDGGLNYEVAGKVITNDLAVHEDQCKDSDTLLEYYCSSDERAFSEKYDCECENDACVEED